MEDDDAEVLGRMNPMAVFNQAIPSPANQSRVSCSPTLDDDNEDAILDLPMILEMLGRMHSPQSTMRRRTSGSDAMIPATVSANVLCMFIIKVLSCLPANAAAAAVTVVVVEEEG